MDAILSDLLKLQEEEGRRMATERELKSVPLELRRVELERAAAEARIEAERTKLKELELRSKQLQHALDALEQRSAKLKGQQMQVKKNEEYQALGREIDGVAAETAAMEEQEIGLLYELDTARSGVKEAEGIFKAEVAEFEGRVKRVREREAALKARLQVELGLVAEGRLKVAAPLLGTFERLVREGKFPAVVCLNGQNCAGCHMRVSNGVGQDAHKSGGKLATCDNCGRLLYLAA